MKKYISSLIIFSSILFLVYYLMSNKLIDFYLFKFDLSFALSLLFLFLGFVISGLSWWYSLKLHGVEISAIEGLISHGLPIFAKYLPGKVWTILGRATRIASKTDIKISELSFYSLKEQLVYLLVGIFISIVPVYIVYGFNFFFLLVFSSGVGLFLIIFNKRFHNLILWIFKKILKKVIEFPLIGLKSGLKLSVINIVLWFTWVLAFYYFGKSFVPDIDISLAFVFPVSVVFGVLAIIMPGGIGVREGVIATFFTLSGMDVELATTISVMSRLWFVLGEVFMFLISNILLICFARKRLMSCFTNT